MSSTSLLINTQRCLTRYGMTTYMIFGNIGLIFNIIIFSQSTHRQKPGSLYMLAMSLCALTGLNISVIPTIYALDHPNPSTSSFFACQIMFYLRHTINQMMRTFFVFACIDRYTMSSKEVHIRLFSQYRIAIRIIPSVIIFWLLLGIFPIMLRSYIDGVCGPASGLNYILHSIYIAITTCIIPLSGMVLFCILLKVNLKNMRRRIQPIKTTTIIGNQFLRRRDRDMLRMLLIEVICYTITTGPLAFMIIYNLATQSIVKNNERLQMESFSNYFFGTFLLYLTNCLSFWIYITTSRSFRLEFKSVIIKFYAFITRTQIQINEIS